MNVNTAAQAIGPNDNATSKPFWVSLGQALFERYQPRSNDGTLAATSGKPCAGGYNEMWMHEYWATHPECDMKNNHIR